MATIGEVTVDFIDSALNFMSIRDSYTTDHCKSVGMLAGQLAKTMQLDAVAVKELQLAGRTHDIGKLTWADVLFSNVDKNNLGPDYDWINYHPTNGKHFLYNALKSLDKEAPECGLRWIEWVWLHHWGYTEKYKLNPSLNDPEVAELMICLSTNCNDAELIHLGVGIMHAADSFHAGISARSYRKGHPLPKDVTTILREMREKSADEYHPQAIKALEKLAPWLNKIFLPFIYFPELTGEVCPPGHSPNNPLEDLTDFRCPDVSCDGLLKRDGPKSELWSCSRCSSKVQNRAGWWKQMDECQRRACVNVIDRVFARPQAAR